jgi:membrane-associated protease RseP (regulator of RpoE activity)
VPDPGSNPSPALQDYHSPASVTYLEPTEPRKFQDRRWLHALLFGLTVLSTTYVGLFYYVGFLGELGSRSVTFSPWASAGYGAWFSVPLLAIMTAHELGHYLACRYYRIDASLPYYIPMLPIPFLPLGVLTGTLGAVIRIREPMHRKHILFDIGIAGPIAGFVVTVPLLVAGLMLSTTAPLPPGFTGLEFGEPLGFKLAQWATVGALGEGRGLNAHPMAMAAWWGLFVTAFNLIPLFQLDGGHISYAVLGRHSARMTYATLAAMAALAVYSPGWRFITIILAILIYRLGPHHPPVIDEDAPLCRARRALAVFAIVMFVLSFTPVPIDIFRP